MNNCIHKSKRLKHNNYIGDEETIQISYNTDISDKLTITSFCDKDNNNESSITSFCDKDNNNELLTSSCCDKDNKDNNDEHLTPSCCNKDNNNEHLTPFSCNKDINDEHEFKKNIYNIIKKAFLNNEQNKITSSQQNKINQIIKKNIETIEILINNYNYNIDKMDSKETYDFLKNVMNNFVDKFQNEQPEICIYMLNTFNEHLQNIINHSVKSNNNS